MSADPSLPPPASSRHRARLTHDIDVSVASASADGTVRLGPGHPRDVSMIDGEVEVLEIDALPQQRGDRFAARTGFDPRAAWREVNEMPDREQMETQ